ncbi:paeninodin family lasso peptide [Paenibacillus sp. sgz500958]
MKKTWATPTLEELKVGATAAGMGEPSIPDAVYVENGKKWYSFPS